MSKERRPNPNERRVQVYGVKGTFHAWTTREGLPAGMIELDSGEVVYTHPANIVFES